MRLTTRQTHRISCKKVKHFFKHDEKSSPIHVKKAVINATLYVLRGTWLNFGEDIKGVSVIQALPLFSYI